MEFYDSKGNRDLYEYYSNKSKDLISNENVSLLLSNSQEQGQKIDLYPNESFRNSLLEENKTGVQTYEEFASEYKPPQSQCRTNSRNEARKQIQKGNEALLSLSFQEFKIKKDLKIRKTSREKKIEVSYDS